MDARDEVILSQISEYGCVSVIGLADLFKVSTVTIRSDLNRLGKLGLIHRQRGGAIRPILGKQEQPLEKTSKHNEAEKRAIAHLAAQHIEEGDTVFIDVGSTCTELARAMNPKLQNVTVVTNGLNIAVELQQFPNLNVVVTGGTLRRLQHSLVSPYGLEVLKSMYFDKAFLGCNGVSVLGIGNKNIPEAEIKRFVAQQSKEVYILADHEKLEQMSTALICPLDKVTLLITDRKAKSSTVEQLKNAGLNIKST